jgi:hypothetical protein
MANSKSVNRLLSKAKKIAVFGDVHIGCHDEPAMRALIECFEREGVDLTIPNGDIHDCAAVSSHADKRAKAVIESGQLAEEAASGRWIVDWLMTRPCIYGEGNHEDWINDLALHTNTVGTVTVASALGLPVSDDFLVLPQGYQIRIGSLAIEHGDEILGRSMGGQHLAATILRRYPAQSTVVNHFHRMDYAVHTTADHNGVPRSFSVHSLGHVSDPGAHADYAGRLPNWQQGGAIIDLWQCDGKQRYTIHPIEIHRDRRNKPVFEYNGHVYR